MGEAGLRRVWPLLRAAGILALGYGALRFLLPWLAPFLAAWALASLLEKPVRWLTRHGWRRSAAAALCTLAALGLLLWALSALLSRGLAGASALLRALPELAEGLSRELTRLEALLRSRVHGSAGGLMLLEQGLSAVRQALAALPGQASRAALGVISRAAQAGPDALLSLVTGGIGSYFLSASFPAVKAFLLAQLPASLRQRLAGLGEDLKSGFGGVLRAQGILMGMTFVELLVAFWLMKLPAAMGLAALTAAIDALPVLGAGIVLLPWALGALLLGQTRRGILLLAAWGAVSLIRSCAQAKLLGDQIGLDPLASLLSVYLGWRACGVWGMLLFPPALMCLTQLNARGVVSLWKSV